LGVLPDLPAQGAAKPAPNASPVSHTNRPDADRPTQGTARVPSQDPARLGTTIAGQVRHSVETLIGRAAVERGMASREQVVQAFEELKKLPPQDRAARFEETFVRLGVLRADQVARLREWVKDDAIGGAAPDPSGSSVIDEAALARPDFIPGFKFRKNLGRGAMGRVVLAEQTSMDRLVAIKLVEPKYAADPAFIERFVREKNISAMLNDPNIVAAYEFGHTSNGIPFMAMEFMDKGSVHEIIEARRRIPEADAIRIARQAACALKHAHSKGLVHRDVKPKNLMLNASGAVKLSDLGLARLANDPVAAAAEKGKVFGTPYYISPEQCRAGDIGPATDIYGLGATLYHMLTGRVPFPGANPKEVMQQHLRAQLVPPDQVVKELSGGISMIVEMMMAKDPRERYHSADHLIEDLDLVARGEPPVHARPKIDSPGAGLEGLEGPAESELVMANAPGTGGLLGSRAGIAILAVLAVSLAANLLLALMLLRR
jgi:hypothetical protein